MLWSGARLAVTVAVVACVVLQAHATEKQRQRRNIMFPNYNEPENYYQNQSRGAFLENGPPHTQHHRARPGHGHGPMHHSAPGRREIPLDFLKRLNDLENIADFFPYVVGGSQNFTDTAYSDIINRFGDQPDERKAVVNAKFAKCMPEEWTVSLLEETNDPSVLYIPSCTRVLRCGGCCSTSILSCQPTEMEILNVRVYQTQYSGDNQLKMTAKKIIPIEQHTKCKCDCIIKAKHCTQLQEYRPEECSCACMNTDEREKCYAANHRKVWDPTNCVCACRQIEECTTGQVFNPATCRCMNIPDRMTRRHTSASELEKRRGEKRRHQPRTVVPIQINEGN